ncbi:MAG TPA: hypothetical protein VGJ26_13230 [Pirellulales bacterium]|jgi:hypothetical protein
MNGKNKKAVKVMDANEAASLWLKDNACICTFFREFCLEAKQIVALQVRGRCSPTLSALSVRRLGRQAPPTRQSQISPVPILELESLRAHRDAPQRNSAIVAGALADDRH